MLNILVFLLGICIGSFLNVCIYRLPLGGSLINPVFSYCPQCTHRLYPKDLVPLFSFLFLKGKCSYCGEKISWRYFLIELLTGLLFLLAYWYWGLTWSLLPILSFISLLVVATFIDLEHQIIPNKLNLWGIILGLILNLLIGSQSLWQMALGVFSAGGIMLLIAILSRGGMGGGDIKMAGVIGIFLGWKLALLSLLFAFFLGGFIGGLLMLLRKKGRKDLIPFGPFLALGSLLALFFGNQAIAWYINTFIFV